MDHSRYQAPRESAFRIGGPCVVRSPSGWSVVFDPRLRAQIVAHARDEPRQEVCGLIGGVGGVAASTHRVGNCASNPARRFLMQPSAQLAALRRMAAAGESLLGMYHSHVATAAEPSATDVREAAYPELLYVIAGPLRGPLPLALRAYLWRAHRFSEVALIEDRSVSLLQQPALPMQHNC